MELLEFIKENPNTTNAVKNCKTQNDLHKLIVQNKIDLKDISETQLFQIIKETQKQDDQVEDELLENVAGGMSNAKQRKIQNKIKEKTDPSKLTGKLKELGNLNEAIDYCINNNLNAGDLLKDENENDNYYILIKGG